MGPKLTITPHPRQNAQNMIQQSSNQDRGQIVEILNLDLAKYAASLFLLTSSITFFRKMIVLLVLLNSWFNDGLDI